MLKSYTRDNLVIIIFDKELSCKHFHKIKQIYTQAELDSEFVLDFSNVSSIDSSSIGILLVMRESLSAGQGKISCINCQSNVLELFRISNMEKLLYFPQLDYDKTA